MNTMNKLAALFLAALALTSCSIIEEKMPDSDNRVRVGQPLPYFSILMNDSTTLTTDSLRGKPSIIVFFNTTCPDCQRELPALNSRFLQHGNDTTIIAISREESFESVSTYWLQQGLSLPFSAQPDRTVYSLFAKKGIPRIYISNQSCIVVKVNQ